MKQAYFGCPGNGGQHHVFYERQFIDTSENQEYLSKINDVAGHDLVGLMLDKEGRSKIVGEADIQLAIVGSGIVLGRAMQKKLSCEGTMGLSLGEVTACALAGCIDDETALHIIKRRAEIMKECVPSFDKYCSEPGLPNTYMCAINNVPLRFIERRCSHVNRRSGQYGHVVVSNENTPRQTVISGAPSAVNKAVHGVKRKYAKGVVIPLKTGGPWHSKFYMATAKEKFAEFLEPIPFRKPSVLLYMMASMRFESDPAKIKENLAEMMVLCMHTWRSLYNIRKAGHELFVSSGPGKVMEPFFNSVGLQYIDRSQVLEEKVAETVLSK